MQKKEQRLKPGFALLVVLIVITIIAVVVVEFSFSAMVNLQIAENRRDEVAVGKGCDTGLSAVLAAFGNEKETLQAIGQMRPPESAKPKNLGEAIEDLERLVNFLLMTSGKLAGLDEVSVDIYDEQSFYNINYMARKTEDVEKLRMLYINRPLKKSEKRITDPSKINWPTIKYVLPEQFKKQFRYLVVTVAEHKEDAANRVIDWVDEDKSGEYEVAQNGEVKSRKLDTLSEMFLIQGLARTFFYEKDGEKAIPVSPFLTIYTDGLVNINTAPKEVLAAIFESKELADAIIAEREARASKGELTPYKSPEELRNIQDMDADKLTAVSPQLTTQSKFFRVIITARSGQLVKKIFCVVQTGGSGAKMIFKRTGDDCPGGTRSNL